MGELGFLLLGVGAILLGATPILSLLKMAEANRHLRNALDRVDHWAREAQRLEREMDKTIDERDEAQIRLDEARKLARHTPAEEQSSER